MTATRITGAHARQLRAMLGRYLSGPRVGTALFAFASAGLMAFASAFEWMAGPAACGACDVARQSHGTVVACVALMFAFPRSVLLRQACMALVLFALCIAAAATWGWSVVEGAALARFGTCPGNPTDVILDIREFGMAVEPPAGACAPRVAELLGMTLSEWGLAVSAPMLLAAMAANLFELSRGLHLWMVRTGRIVLEDDL